MQPGRRFGQQPDDRSRTRKDMALCGGANGGTPLVEKEPEAQSLRAEQREQQQGDHLPGQRPGQQPLHDAATSAVNL